MDKKFLDKFDELIEKPCYIVDFLPRKVPENSDGQFFEVERYLLKHPQIEEIYKHFINIILKINCYYNFEVYFANENKLFFNPSPEKLIKNIMHCANDYKNNYIDIIIKSQNTLITLNGNDLNLSIYNPSKDLSDLIFSLAISEGLFFWKP